MRHYVAVSGETLRSIASKKQVRLDELIFLNPHIGHPDRIPSGCQVKLPPFRDPTEYAGTSIPVCPHVQPSASLLPWIPLMSVERMAETEYDVLIVGTGAGGGAVLWRLCEQWGGNGKKIGVIEAGDVLLQTHGRNIATFNEERFNAYSLNPEFWKTVGSSEANIADKPADSLPVRFQQFYALGGRTIIWGTDSPRMNPLDIAEWPVPLEEMEEYYTLAEQVMNVNNNFSSQSSISQILLKRLIQGGFPETTYRRMAINLNPTNYGQNQSSVYFSSIEFLARALNLRHFDLAVKARAVQVLGEQGTVSGVKVMTPDKRSYQIKAKTVVLSASTFETPRILLYSGIRGRAVGHYLTNHSSAVGLGKIGREQFSELLGTLGIMVPRTANRPYQIQLWGPADYYTYQPYESIPPLKEIKFTIYGLGMVEPSFENKVSLSPYKRDEYGVPELEVQFSYSEKDFAVIRKMVEGIRQAAAAMKASLISIDGQSEVCFQLPGGEHHGMGTCRMGTNPDTSVTNPYGQVHGIPGLYIADNSVIPASGAANPTLTTVALAIRTADHILQKRF